jgi:hypothetical protein
MKFDDYITEVDKKSLSLYSVLDTLKKDCKPFIKELKKSGKEVLWRGTYARTKTLIRVTPRMDRTPKDTPEKVHDELNDRFKKKFGWEVRSEGVFATSGYSSAADYGTPHIFFPVGKYKYVFNPRIEDLWNQIESDYIEIINVYDEDFDYIADWEEAYEDDYGEGASGSWYYEGGDTGEVDIDSAIKAAAEAEDYDTDEINDADLEWVPDVTWEQYKTDKFEDVEDQAEAQLTDLMDGYRKNNLGLAVRSKVEIHFNCKSYYLVDEQYAPDIERHLLRGKPYKETK